MTAARSRSSRFAVIALMLCFACTTSGCSIVAAAFDGIFGDSEEEAAAKAAEEKGGDPVLEEPMLDEEGRFDPSLVLEGDDVPALPTEIAPNVGADDPVARPKGPAGEAREAAGPREGRAEDASARAVDREGESDQEEKVARASNPEVPSPGEPESESSEWVDLLFEMGVLVLVSALIAATIGFARRHTAGFAALTSMLALVVAVLAIVA